VASRGTAYYRLRRSRRTFDDVVSLLAEGNTPATLSRAFAMCASTVLRWRDRAAAHARRFSDQNATMEDPVEIQVDEVRSYGIGDGERSWVFSGIEVWSRYWAGVHVGRRTLRTTKLFMRSLARTCPQDRAGPPVIVATDDLKYYVPAFRRTFPPTCVHVQVKNRYARGRILRTRARLVTGSMARMEAAQRRSEDSKRPNTSYIERLNLTMRRSCSYLHRRTPARVRNPQHLADLLEIIRCHYNFVRPHSSLKFGKETRTPAMQAGIVDRRLTLREIFSTVFPPRQHTVQNFRDGSGRIEVRWS
jgi:transposase InsO family protein